MSKPVVIRTTHDMHFFTTYTFFYERNYILYVDLFVPAVVILTICFLQLSLIHADLIFVLYSATL